MAGAKMTQCDKILHKSITEEWRTVKGYEGFYEISNLGAIRSYQNFGFGLRKEPKTLKAHKDKYGYPTVTLCKEGKRTQRTIHSLVADAFVTGKKEGLQIDHINGIKTDNRAVNLEWVTPKENTLRSVRLGLKPRGEKHGNHKLKKTEVDQIREMYKTGNYSQRKLGELFGVSNTVVGKIVRNKMWVI